ncbi:MAG: hypothetical protein SF052_18215 [Bacteroidia bacterium]|nr:hypothetical protein [Bacteroidia bacterium]
MKTRISTVLIFVLLMMIVLTVGWWLERKSFEQQISTLEDEMDKQVTFRRNHNLWLHDIMREDIRDEELNMGKYTNSGLKDTLRYIESRTSEILAHADTTRLEDFLEWGAELKKIYYAQFRMPSEDTLSFSDLTAESILPVQGRLRVLEWEWDVIDLLNRRLGVVTCFSSRYFNDIAILPETDDGFKVKEGENFEGNIYVQLKQGSSHNAWKTTLGRVTYSENDPVRLFIPTNGLLPAGQKEKEIVFSVTGLFLNDFGKFESVTTNAVLTVVRE